MAPAELILTKLPPPWTSRCGIATAQVFHVPMRFTSTTVRQWSEVVLSQGATVRTPALATAPSNPPRFVDALVDRRAHSRFVADISDSAHTAAAVRGDQTHRLGQVVLGGQVVFDLRQGLTEVDENEISALLGESDRVTAPQTACGTGDQHAFAGRPAARRSRFCHHISPRMIS